MTHLLQMCDEKCRLCLSETNLTPLFKISDQINEYSSILFITTGLKIEASDGLPQKICKFCTKAVDVSFNLRNKSQQSEKMLLGEKLQRNHENSVDNDLKSAEIFNKEDKNIEFIDESNDIEELQIDSKLDHNKSSNENGAEIKWPFVKKLSKKEKRQMYMDLVEGDFNPNGRIKCKICKNTVSKWRCFLSHVKLHLGFNFMCEFCGKSFISTTQLKRHCRSHHSMKRELKCKHCSYLALDNGQLKLHVRRLHTGERPYICDVCASSYHSRKCLIQHIESHRTEANVQCSSCSKVFKSHRALARHRYSTHAHKRVQCPHCVRAYTRKYIKAHVEKCHGEVYNS